MCLKIFFDGYIAGCPFNATPPQRDVAILATLPPLCLDQHPTCHVLSTSEHASRAQLQSVGLPMLIVSYSGSAGKVGYDSAGSSE